LIFSEFNQSKPCNHPCFGFHGQQAFKAHFPKSLRISAFPLKPTISVGEIYWLRCNYLASRPASKLFFVKVKIRFEKWEGGRAIYLLG
jgi:hypothetical protein